MPEWIEGEMHGDLTDMTRYDCERLHALISKHARYTGSQRAQAILADWRNYLPKFRKVMPLEFSRALAEMEKARTMQAAE
jgi:glutamate synthase (NADPH) large chain